MAHLEHDLVDNFCKLVFRAFGQEWDVGPGISPHKLLDNFDAGEEVVNAGCHKAHALESQHH